MIPISCIALLGFRLWSFVYPENQFGEQPAEEHAPVTKRQTITSRSIWDTAKNNATNFLGSYILVGLLDTGTTLNMVSFKAAQHSGVTIKRDYADVAVCVGDGRKTRTMATVIRIIHLGSREVSYRA